MKKHFKKIIILLVLGFFTFSSYSNVISKQLKIQENQNINTNLDSFELEFSFSYPEIVEHYNYSVIKVNETNHNRIKMFDYETNYPVLPVNLSVFEFPFGTIINNVTYENSTQKIIDLKNKIICGKAQFDSINPIKIKKTEIKDLYNNLGEYPENWVEYHTGGGLSYGKRVTFLVLRAYPVRYYPNQHKIGYVSKIKINVSFQEPKENMINEDEKKDLLIISPEKYSKILSPLIDFKNDKGVKTLYFSTEEIYNEDLLPGIDDAEKIKYFIKGAIERWNITHVLLVGGIRHQSKNWDIPVRYSYVVPTDEQEYPEQNFLSDLYYADIYEEGGGFSSWDSNDDGIYAHWDKLVGVEDDILDLNPDVFIGRLPCRSKLELSILSKKIINYESTTPASKSWFTTMVCIGGLSHDMYLEQPDGEYLCDVAFDHMDDLIDKKVKVYASNNGSSILVPKRLGIIPSFIGGAGYVLFEGHGHPLRWDTHPIEGTNTWFGGIHMRNFGLLLNFKKLPFVVVGGCHNGQFNVTWYRTKNYEEFDDIYWTHGDPGSECFSWRLLTIPYGGGIASVGASGLTVSWVGQPISLNSEIEMNIFYKIGIDKVNTPGQSVGGAIQKFIDENNVQITEAHCIAIVHLFGDPSLQFGGFE